jgi:SAM-dependent methyltransferase
MGQTYFYNICLVIYNTIYMKFEDIINNDKIFLYCGDLPEQRRKYSNMPFVGLSLKDESSFWNIYHIQHDITKPMPLKDNTVDTVQSEDVMEHIEYNMLKKSINEIYRVLKPGGLFRLSMPDYKCDLLYNRSEKDSNKNIIFDREGGGQYDKINKKVIRGGHVWFPVFSSVKSLLESTNFLNDKINYLHYYDDNNNPITNKISYNKGFISRTPDHDNRVKKPYRPMSIVVDCYK